MMSFAAPWALLGLLALPVLWWWLRLTPPAPRRVVFPPLRLLLGLASRRETADRIPFWLLLLRLVLVALLVLGAAHPLLNAQPVLRGQGPLVLAVDDGWAAAAGWG
ncbi:MAG: BatA domain-containing protein, partial [Magnetospirillum sp. WYHS-4]